MVLKSLPFAVLLLAVNVIHDAATLQEPLWTSQPFQGTGGWANYTVQIEILSASSSVDSSGNYRISLVYDYILTDANGQVMRVTPEVYNQKAAVASQVVTSSTPLDMDKRFYIVFNGMLLEPLHRTLIALALNKAYTDANPAWAASNNSVVVMAAPDELIGPLGQPLTGCGYWVVNASGAPLGAQDLKQPDDAAIWTALMSYGISPTKYRSSVYFDLSASLGVYVVGVVRRRDLASFQTALTSYWSTQLASYNLSLVVLTPEKHFTADGSPVTRLVYFFYSGSLNWTLTTFKAFDWKAYNWTEPTSAQLATYVQQANFGDSVYQLFTGQTGLLYPAKKAYYLRLWQRPAGNTTLSDIQQQAQAAVRKATGDSTVQVVVVAFEDSFDVQKMTYLVNVYWYVIASGTLVDGRRVASSPEMSDMLFQYVANVTLPNGAPLMPITDMSVMRDKIVSRSSCYQLVVNASVVTNYSAISWALKAALGTRYSTLNMNFTNVTVTVVGNEEFVNGSGMSLTVISYVLQLSHQNFTWLVDASELPELYVTAADLATYLRIYNLTTIANLTTYMYQPSSNIWGLFLLQNPPPFLFGTLTASVSSALQLVLRTSVTVRFARVEEFKMPNGMSCWKLGFLVWQNGMVVLPETIASLKTTDLNVMTSRGDLFTVISNFTVTQSLVRVADLFQFYLNVQIAQSDLAAVAAKLSMAWQMAFPVGSWPMIKAKPISSAQLIVSCGSAMCPPVNQLSFQLTSGMFTLSARQFPMLNASVAMSVFSSFTAPSGQKYQLLPPPPPNATIFSSSQVFTFIFNELIQPTDIQTIQNNVASLLLQLLPPGAVTGLQVKVVSQQPVKYVCSSRPANGKACRAPRAPLQPNCVGNGPDCSGLVWAVSFVVSTGSQQIPGSSLPTTNLTVQQQQQITVGTKVTVLDTNVTSSQIVNAMSGFVLTFSRPPNNTEIDAIVNVVTAMFQMRFNSTVSVTFDGPVEVVNLLTNMSMWQMWFSIAVDNQPPLDSASEAPINVTLFNLVLSQSPGINITAANVTTNDTVSVSWLFSFYVTGFASRLDFFNFSLVLGRVFNGVASQVAVTVVQTHVYISDNGTILSEIRAVVRQNGMVVNPASLPAIDLSAVTSLLASFNLRGSNQVVLRPPTMLFSRRMTYVLLLSDFIVDEDVPACEGNLTAMYRTLDEFVGVSVSVKILTQLESVMMNGSTVVQVVYVLLVNGTVYYVPSWGANMTGVVLYPTADKFVAALANVHVSTDDSDVTVTYSSLVITNTSITFVEVTSLIMIPFRQMIADANFPDLFGILTRFFFVGFQGTLNVVKQEDWVDDQGQFYTMVHILATNIDGMVWPYINFPRIVVNTSVITAISNIRSPSGISYNITDMRNVTLNRYALGWNIYFNQSLPRYNISALLAVFGKLLPANKQLSLKFGCQDRIVDANGVVTYKVTLFGLRGNGPVDLRTIRPVRTVDLNVQLAVQLPSFKTVFSAAAAAKLELISFRRSQSLVINGFVNGTDISAFLTQLQILWATGPGSFKVKPHFYTEECVGADSQTVTRFYYFMVSANNQLVDMSAVATPSASVFAQYVFNVVGGGVYTAYTQSLQTIASYSGLFKLRVVGKLDLDDALALLGAIKTQWIAYASSTNVNLQLFGMKPCFARKSLITELLYSVSINGTNITSGPDLAPPVSISVIQQAVSSVSLYPYLEPPVRVDYTFTLVLSTAATSDVIQQQITAAWQALPGFSQVVINITGIETRTVVSRGIEVSVTYVYYLVVYANGVFVSPANQRPPPSFAGLTIFTGQLNAVVQYQTLQLSSSLLVSTSGLQKIRQALIEALIAYNPGFTLTFDVRISTSRTQQRVYSRELSAYGVRIYYIIFYNGVDIRFYPGIRIPPRSFFNVRFRRFGFRSFEGRCKKSRRFFLRFPRGSFSSIQATATNAFQRAWRGRFPSCRVSCRSPGSSAVGRKRRAATDEPQPVDMEVDTDDNGLDPPDDSLPGDEPTEADQIDELAAADLSTCSPCAVTNCYQLLAVGAAPSDRTALQNVLVNAFSASTGLTPDYFISANVTGVEPTSGGSTGSLCISYCLTSNNTDLVTPADDDWTTALAPLMLTYTPSNGTCMLSNMTLAPASDNPIVVVIVVAVVGGAGTLFFIAAVYMFLTASSAAPVQTVPPPTQPTVQSYPNFSSRGLYNPQRFGTLNRGRGLYVTRVELPRTAW